MSPDKEEKKQEEKKQEEKKQKKKGSFWTTLPGIITAITGLIVAVTGLISVLGDEGILNPDATPTPFPTVTPVDSDVILPTPEDLPPVDEPDGVPTCMDFVEYGGSANPNAVILAYTGAEFWVRYAKLEKEVNSLDGLVAYIFDPGPAGGDCLRQWVRYLGSTRLANWPVEGDTSGRTFSEVWLSSSTPPRLGELVGWERLPDMLLITVVEEDLTPLYAQVYHCGRDVPSETLGQTAYWHAATDEDALAGYLTLYETNGFDVKLAVPCQ